MSLFTLYLLFVLCPSIVFAAHDIAAFASCLMAIACGCWILGYFISNLVDEKFNPKEVIPRAATVIKTSAIVYLICMGVWTVVPSQDQVYTIAGGYIATNTKGIAKLPENLVGAANDYLESVRKSIAKGN